jgi:hypothetical protein
MTDSESNERTYTLSEIIDLHASNLIASVHKNGIAVIVCALTERRFEAQVLIAPEFSKGADENRAISKDITDFIYDTLKTRLELDLKEIPDTSLS